MTDLTGQLGTPLTQLGLFVLGQPLAYTTTTKTKGIYKAFDYIVTMYKAWDKKG